LLVLFSQISLTLITNARDKKEKVWTAQAEHYFAQHKYDLAATYFRKTQRGFEEITLRFISLDSGTGGRDALKKYLNFHVVIFYFLLYFFLM